jgi:hypothetical protein
MNCQDAKIKEDLRKNGMSMWLVVGLVARTYEEEYGRPLFLPVTQSVGARILWVAARVDNSDDRWHFIN